MTEAEALDKAANIAGWDCWEAAKNSSDQEGLRAHAATIMQNAALEAKLADVSKALMATAGAAASSAKKGMEAEAKLAVAREALVKAGNFIGAMVHSKAGEKMFDHISAALKEISNGDR